MILGLTSKALTRGQMYDSASTVLAQKLLPGERHVAMSTSAAARAGGARGAESPSMNGYGINPEGIRAAIVATNANRPKAHSRTVTSAGKSSPNDQSMYAKGLRSAHRRLPQRAAVRLGDIAQVSDSVQDLRNEDSPTAIRPSC